MNFTRRIPERFRAPLAIVIVGLLAYGRIVMFDFVMLDDTSLVADRTEYLARTSNVVDAFVRDYWYGTGDMGLRSYYRPMVTVSYILDAAISPGSARVSHATNLALHLAVALALLALLKRILPTKDLASLLALVFVAHPLASNAVGWIPGRHDTLMALFVLLSFIAFIDHVRSGSRLALAGYACAFAAALLSKETAVVTPMLLFMWILLEEDARKKKRWLAPLLVSACIITLWWIARTRIIIAIAPPDPGESFIANLPVFVYSLGKALFPFNLSAVVTIADTAVLSGIVVFVGLIALAWRTDDVHVGRLMLGMAWFIIVLLPSLFLGMESAVPILECRAYLPLIGVLLVLAELEPVRSFSWEGNKAAVAGGVVLVGIVLSEVFVSPYASAEAMWSSVIRTAPSSAMAHLKHGTLLESDSLLTEAEQEYREAARLDPQDPAPYSHIAGVVHDRRALDSVEADFRTQVDSVKRSPMAWYSLATFALRRHDTTAALAHLRSAVTANPAFAKGWQKLATLSMQTSNRTDVVECVERLKGLGLPPSPAIRAYLKKH